MILRAYRAFSFVFSFPRTCGGDPEHAHLSDPVTVEIARVGETADTVEARALSFYTNLRRATKDVLYVWLNARVSQDPGYVRPAKKTGVSWVRVCVAVADIVVLAGAAALIARRRSRARA